MADEFGRDGIEAVPVRAAEAAAALEALKRPAEDAADAIEAAFGRAGESLTRSLARAAADGEVSLSELARAVLEAVNAASSGGSGQGLNAAIQAAMSSFGGARADGGPVLGGGAYLVGERGPEVFRPTTGGEVGPASGGGVTVNVAVEGGAPALLRSEAQIAQMLARAVSLGARRM
ncbi:phage tail tape measure protein [uncultured Brevundimonas sp.]|uniref:phage tail tape measure protein n=1 Tax=uncultured Brevundimonas sp. TaxID=213418 RepID=UPI002637F834|nr:phage tail tape measure protein [uncultured Brevundimonas sp.]